MTVEELEVILHSIKNKKVEVRMVSQLCLSYKAPVNGYYLDSETNGDTEKEVFFLTDLKVQPRA